MCGVGVSVCGWACVWVGCVGGGGGGGGCLSIFGWVCVGVEGVCLWVGMCGGGGGVCVEWLGGWVHVC